MGIEDTSRSRPEPVCVGCNRIADEIPEYVQEAEADNKHRARKGLPQTTTPASFIRRNEGTYNRHNGHFLCTGCYIAAGQPSAPGGWIAP